MEGIDVEEDASQPEENVSGSPKNIQTKVTTDIVSLSVRNADVSGESLPRVPEEEDLHSGECC